MAKKLSEHLGIVGDVLDEIGVFDPILSVDSKFFIDPKSLSGTSAYEFSKSYDKLAERYAQIFTLITESKTVDDRFWSAAYKHFPKGEVEEICVGYGFDNTGGRGIGPKLVREVMGTLKDFINSGIDDPVLLELVGLFQKGVGSDIISDMTARVLQDEIVAYTTRITTLLSKRTEIKPQTFDYNSSEQLAFYNPHNNKLIFLLPADILQPLPLADDWESIDRVCAENAQIRNEFAKMIGAYDWKRATKKVSKDVLKRSMVSHPAVVRDLLDQYRNKPAKLKYDFNLDPSGEYNWYNESQRITKENPLHLSTSAKTPDEVNDVVCKIIENFKRIIEDNGGWGALYTRGKTPVIMHESYAQKLFFGVADGYCDANDLDISPETNSGRGPIDFKFSNGKRAKVLVEIKFSSNPQLSHGFTVQVAEYEKAERPHASHYLVLDVTANKTYMKQLTTTVAKSVNEGKRTPVLEYVDAKVKKSASKA